MYAEYGPLAFFIGRDVTFAIIGPDTFSCDENTQIKMKGRDPLFQHTEKNVMVRCTETR